MADLATPEQVAEYKRTQQQLAKELVLAIKASYKAQVLETIQGMMEKNASPQEIVQAMENAGYFEGDTEPAAPEAPVPAQMEAAPPPAPLPPEPPAPTSRRDEYMAAAQRQMV